MVKPTSSHHCNRHVRSVAHRSMDVTAPTSPHFNQLRFRCGLSSIRLANDLTRAAESECRLLLNKEVR